MKEPDCCSNDRAVTTIHAAEVLSADPASMPAPRDGLNTACAACGGGASRPVTRQTMLLMLKPELIDDIGEGEYRFCSDPECGVVYFTEGEGRRFITDDLRIRVGLKERGGDAALCYCFGFNESDAREEIGRTGRSTLPQRITALIKQGMCACAARNPSGACCLGEVSQAIKRLMENVQRGAFIKED